MGLFSSKRNLVKGLVGIVFLGCSVGYFIFRPFEQKGRFFYRIPLVFMANDVPCFEGKINGNNYFFELDTGLNFTFSIKESVINQINEMKRRSEKIDWYDVKGNVYSSFLYTIDLINVSGLKMGNVTARSESPDFISKGSVIWTSTTPKYNNRSMIAGSMGAHALRKNNYWLIDFPNSSFVAIRDIKKTPNFTFEDFYEVPLENVWPHIVISVDTELGVKKFMLDTGASHTFLRTLPGKQPNQFISVERFKLGSYELGPVKCYLFDMTEKMKDFDGIIGRDFFRKHAVLLDFKNQKALIGPVVSEN